MAAVSICLIGYVQFRMKHLLSLKSCTTYYGRTVAYSQTLRKQNRKMLDISEFPEQQVKIETCGKLYEKWKLEKRFSKVPSGNLAFNVRYIDTLISEDRYSEVTSDSPIILALHGAPGSYTDYDNQILFLSKHGIRVIAPCFPDFTDYSPGVFRYTCEEKTQYIKDFLQKINVSSVDVLLTHSGSIYPALQLCCDNYEPKVYSLGLLNPGPSEGTVPIIQPLHVMKALVRMSEEPHVFSILKVIAPPLMRLAKIPVVVDDLMSPLLTITTMINAGYKKASENIEELHQRKFPIYVAFSNNDKLVPCQLIYRMAYKLGLHDSDITHINKDGSVVSKGRCAYNATMKAFLTGSHYAFRKYADIINEDLYTFIQDYTVYSLQDMKTSTRLLRA